MDERGVRGLPEGIESMPAGGGLAALLDGVDPSLLSGFDVVRLVAAQRRQLCFEQARFAEAARAAARAEQDARRASVRVDRFRGDELRAVLCTSRTKVAALLGLGDIAEGFPVLGAAWRAGWVDEDRVRIIAERTASLSLEHRGEVIERVVCEAGGLTLSALAQRVGELAVGLDPGWAEKSYRRRCAQRRVRSRRTEGGTMNLSGLDLPLDEAARSVARITVLAARAQAAGHPGRVDVVRADVYVALLSVDAAGDDAVVAAAVAAGRARAVEQDGDAPGEPLAAEDAPDDSAPDDSGRDGGPGPVARSRGRTWPRQARVELRVGLGTVLGLDQRPARLPGYGVVHAELARDLARQYTHGQWRVAVCDDDGPVRWPVYKIVPGVGRSTQ